MSFEFVIKAYAFQSLLLHAAPGLGHREDHGHEALHLHARAWHRAGALRAPRGRGPKISKIDVSPANKIDQNSDFERVGVMCVLSTRLSITSEYLSFSLAFREFFPLAVLLQIRRSGTRRWPT